MNDADPTAETVLEGGIANRGFVVRIGPTVRKPRRATSPATEALLRHLEGVGFDAAPRFLGQDDAGRDVLSYIPGHTVEAPYPAWVLSAKVLRDVVRLLREYHDAVASFDPAPYDWPFTAPTPYSGALVNHNDPNLDNVVFRDGRAVALIDFDLAAPGCRLWDVAVLARLWAPLRLDRDIPDERRGHSLSRFRLIADTYGLPDGDRERLVDAVLRNHDWLYGIIRAEAAAGHAGFGAYWADAAARVTRTADWYAGSHGLLLEALA